MAEDIGSLDVHGLVESEITRLTNQCGACAWISERTADEQKLWDEVMADRKRYPHSAIHRAIHKADPATKVGRGSVENHRVNRHRA